MDNSKGKHFSKKTIKSKMLKGDDMERVLSKQLVIEFIRKKGKNYEWKTKTGKPFVVSIEGESIYCQPIGKAGVKIDFSRLNKFIDAWNELGVNALTSEYRDFVGGGFGISYIPIILDECFTNKK